MTVKEPNADLEKIISEYTRKDFASDQDVRWCPGCGDYSILAQVQRVMPSICQELQVARENIVFVSGIGCSSRFPYYMDTYGFHSIHGRAPTFATGLRVSRPDLQVWMVTGDGDGLSIGANHLIHALRRNIDIKILLFNNRIYGLTKGQYSPTSEMGKKTKSSPMGSIENPLNPLYMAIAAEATFVGRAVATESKNMQDMIMRAARHKGAAFIEIFQNCNVFNDNAFDSFTSRSIRDERTVDLVHGEPLLFGKEKEKALIFDNEGMDIKIKAVNRADVEDSRLLIHDERAEPNFLARLLASMDEETLPIPLGVFRSLEKPIYGDLLRGQIEQAKASQGEGELMKQIYSGDTWTVN